MDIDIIYEDRYILAVHKPAGVATQTARLAQSDVVSMAKKYLRTKADLSPVSKEAYIGLIGRLDQPVEGIVLMGLNSDVTAALNNRLTSGGITKRYTAVCVSKTLHKTDTCSAVPLEDHLMFDPKANISRIAAPDARGSKAAKLIYEIQKSIPAPVTDNDGIFLNLTDIELITGRHHQIRVQMSNANLPILGDKKYAPEYVQTVSKLLKVPHTALCACELCFTHPVTNDIIDLRVEPQGMWYSFFKN